MSLKKQLIVHEKSKKDRNIDLSLYSHARLGLGHTGGHLKLADWLNFQMGFAQAKDAVFSHFDISKIETLCETLRLDYLQINSCATDPTQFLLRPDLGRQIENPEPIKKYLDQHHDAGDKDLLIVVSGGLSPIAIQHQLPEFFPLLISQLQQQNWTIAPVIINPRGRVALGDAINYFFNAKMVVMLIGERPGLTTPDSLGIYFTYQAKPGYTDEQRNCISNIHQQGLSYVDAVNKLIYLFQKSFANKISGIALKDDYSVAHLVMPIAKP